MTRLRCLAFPITNPNGRPVLSFDWLIRPGSRVLFEAASGTPISSHLRATASKYGESHDSSENSDFFLLRQKDPFGELFSEIYFQSSSEFTFLWNLGKFEIQLNQPRWPMEFIQNCTFSTRQYRKKGTCLDFIFTQFVIYSLVILLS